MYVYIQSTEYRLPYNDFSVTNSLHLLFQLRVHPAADERRAAATPPLPAQHHRLQAPGMLLPS